MAVIDLDTARMQRLVETLPSRDAGLGKQYCFAVKYQMPDGIIYVFDLWAYSEKDAKDRVEAIRGTGALTWMNVLLDDEGEISWRTQSTQIPADKEQTPEA